jgi:hypothetical protein
MSNNEIGQIKGTVYQQDLPALVTGTLASTPVGTVATPFTAQSRILGLQLKTLGTVDNPVFINVLTSSIADTLLGRTNISLFASTNTNTSIYTIYWYNETGAGLNVC